MVLSKIDSSVSYPELKRANPEDADMEADIYAIHVKGVDIVIAIGNTRDDFKKKNILYFPIYLVKSNSKVVQIGVYEVPQNRLGSYLDKDGDLDLEKVGDPLIYSFATKMFLESKRLLPPSEDEEDDKQGVTKKKQHGDDESGDENGDEEDKERLAKKTSKRSTPDAHVIPESRADIFIMTKGVDIPPALEEESKDDAKNIREKYKEDKHHVWIQKFMKNPYYGMVENEGEGDCFFATIRDGFSQIAQQTSVAKIRKKLAEEATQDVFSNYRELYDMYNTTIIRDTDSIKKLAKSYVEMKDKFANTIDRDEQKVLVEDAKQVQQQHDTLVREKKVTSDMLNEFKYMKKVDSLEKFKKLIQTCDFWGETWSISTMERILNIKFILMSSEAYASKDTDNVLNCGQLNDNILQNRGYFNPDYYLILEYTGSHYKLVSYKDKQIFTFPEIPYDIKKLIVDKCLERNAGPFVLIKEFTDLKRKVKSASPASSKDDNGDLAFDVDELSDSKLQGLYNDDIVFSVYAKSATKPKPGKGSGEKIPNNYDAKHFVKLAIIPDWRRKLANTWEQPFVLDNHKWNSVEHYYQAAKFKKDHPEFYLSFSLDSGTELSKDLDMAIAAGKKSGKYRGELIRPKQVQVDPDFFGERAKREMRDAQEAKFVQNADLKNILILTDNAKIVEHKRGRDSEVYDSLMIIREKIKKNEE